MRVKNVSSSTQGLELAKEILYKAVDLDTVLFLSGGSTPKSLYGVLAKEKKLKPGAIALVDERFGKPFHENSNEKMIQKTGLPSYFSKIGVPYYSILKKGKDRKTVTLEYNKVVSSLFSRFSKRVAILGIGSDGHTAGIAPNRADFQNPLFSKERNYLLASEFEDKTGPFGQRITLTFKSLTLMNILLVLVFGESKKEALRKMFTSGSIEEIPARFYLQQDISKKTILITDQKV